MQEKDDNTKIINAKGVNTIKGVLNLTLEIVCVCVLVRFNIIRKCVDDVHSFFLLSMKNKSLYLEENARVK